MDIEREICLETKRYSSRLNKRFCSNITILPRFHYDLPSNFPAVGWVNSEEQSIINLNMDYCYSTEDKKLFIKQVIPHEVAHCFDRTSGVLSHGYAWIQLMHYLKKPPLVTWDDILKKEFNRGLRTTISNNTNSLGTSSYSRS